MIALGRSAPEEQMACSGFLTSEGVPQVASEETKSLKGEGGETAQDPDPPS